MDLEKLINKQQKLLDEQLDKLDKALHKRFPNKEMGKWPMADQVAYLNRIKTDHPDNTEDDIALRYEMDKGNLLFAELKKLSNENQS